MSNTEIKVIRYSEENENIEALKGIWGQYGDKNAVFTIVKNLLVINLMHNAKYDSVKLPTCYDRIYSMFEWFYNSSQRQ